MSTSFVGCKDYDDDITEINGNTSDLGNQITALKEQLQQQATSLSSAAQSAQAAADQANAAAKTAQESGDAAMAQAQAALAAANQAKADALAALSQQAADQAAKYAALENMIKAANDEIAKSAGDITAMKTQFEALTAKVDGFLADVTALQGRIAAVEGKLANIDLTKMTNDIADLLTKVAANALAITANQSAISANATAIAELKTSFENEIAGLKLKYDELKDAITTINTWKESAELQLAALDNFKESMKNVNGDISSLQTQMADAETKLTTLLETTIPGLTSRLDKIESDFADALDDIADLRGDISDINSTIDALKGDLNSAINKVKNDLTSDINNLKSDLQSDIANLKSDLASDIADINSDIADVKSDLTAINADITRIDGALTTLSQILNRRLSSVTFVPKAYVDGIPAIDFSSIEYVPMIKAQAGNWVANPAANAAKVNVASTDIKAVYRLNPTTVGLEDIVVSGIEFVDGIATSRADAAPAKPLIQVAENGASINKNGELELNVVKTSDALFGAGLASNQINIVALKVPVAKEHLFADETEANVFSEYVRLAEFQLTPQIGQVGVESAEAQFNDSITAYTGTDVETVKVPYSTEQDLLEIVNAVLINKGKWFEALETPEARAAYGLDLKFHIAKAKNEVDGVDQQIFGKVEGSTFTPVVPTGYSVQSMPGMTPIVAATLFDTKNNKVVDQRYLKLELSAEKANYKAEFNFASDLFCGEKTWNVSWADFKKAGLDTWGTEELGFLTQDEFIKYYVEEGEIKITYSNYAEDAEESGVNATFVKADANAITWVVDADQVGEVKTNKTVTATIVLTNDLRGTITITLNFVVTNNAAKLPKLGTTSSYLWSNETMLIYPTNPADADADAKATYNTNILMGRDNPFVTGLLDCAGYYMFLPTTVPTTTAYLEYPEDYTDAYSITSANQKDLEYVRFVIENNAAGIAMVENEQTINMDWKAYLNGETAGNLYTIGTSKLKVLKPLKLATVNSENALVDNSEPVSVSLENYYTITDAYDNVIFKDAEVVNENLYNYYGIEAVTFGPSNKITIANNIEGKDGISPESIKLAITVTEDGELTYQNMGAALQDNGYIIVPVTIKHLWGTLEGTIAVPLQKKF